MTLLAETNITLDQIQTLIGILSALGTFAGALLVLWLRTKFVSKTAYYKDKDEFNARFEALDKRMAAVELEHAMFKGANMQKSLEGMQTRIESLTKIIEDLKTTFGTTMHDIDKRVFGLERSK